MMQSSRSKHVRSPLLPAILAVALASIAGCSLTPQYERPELPLPMLGQTTPHADEAPTDQGSQLSQEETELLASLDPAGLLKTLTERALSHNRDYQIAMLRVEQARAEYGITKSERLPSVQATGQMERQQFDNRTLNELNGQRYSSATVGFNDFELDFFGRVKALSDQARHQYLASELGQQASRKALITEVAQGFIVLRAEADRKQRADALLQRRQEQVEMARRQVEVGGLSREDLQASMTLFAQAHQQFQAAMQNLIKARNALELLTGYSTAIKHVGNIPGVWQQDQVRATWLTNLYSTKLLERFDVRAAEEQLKGANASIGAARAAFFPSIRVSTGAGIASEHLHDLFSNSTGTWLFAPQINIPIFDGGRNQANLDLAKVRKHISVAHYENVIQHAFRDMVDGFAERDALMQRLRSQAALNDLAQEQLEHRRAQANRGDASRLDELTAQIQAVQTEQALFDTKLALQMNLLSLYRVLYGADASAISS